MLKAILVVGSGSFVGGALRYLVSTAMKGIQGGSFPWGTLLVNLLGCLLIGLLCGVFTRLSLAQSNWNLLLVTGLCGGFTTFSTFSNEGLALLQGGNISAFLLYVLGSVAGGILLVALGYFLAR